MTDARGNGASLDVAVVGAGVVGAACALACARRGLSVVVLDKGGLVAGTTGSGEGNLLVSDKLPGPELDLALLSNRLWRELAAELSPTHGDIELERKGGLVVAATQAALDAVRALVGRQAVAGVQAVDVAAAALPDYEPHLAQDLAGGVFYPQDMQLQPARATAAMLAAARAHGAHVALREPVVGIDRTARGAVAAVRTPERRLAVGIAVVAAGAWAGQLCDLFGIPVPVAPRRGFILVTEPVEPIVRHKVYSADYVNTVASDDVGLQTSTVVEGTPSGTILIGATREIAGHDRQLRLDALAALATGAVRLFPRLADVQVIRAYRGFRPFSADHLPLIGPDPRVSGLIHAHGHEGAGIGLAPATGELVAQTITGEPPGVDLAPFDPARFTAEVIEHAR